MLPVLYRIPGTEITIYSYGFFLGIGLLLGLYITAQLAKSDGIAAIRTYLIALCVLPAALLGTKLLSIGQLWQQFESHGRFIQALNAPGFYFGGFIVGLTAYITSTHAFTVPGWKLADASAPGLAFGNVLGRIGCFAAGCCWGKPTTSSLGVTFQSIAHQQSGTPPGIPLIPTQLIESGANLLIFGLLCFQWTRRSFQGQMTLIYLILYSIERFIVEFWRDDPRGHVIIFSTSQFISLNVFVFAIILYWWQSTRSPSLISTPTTRQLSTLV